MAEGRSGQGDTPERSGRRAGRRRGSVTVTLSLPRFVVARPLATGRTGFYFVIAGYYRNLGCTIPNEPLGDDYETACGPDGSGGRAAALNALFDEWRAHREGEPVKSIAKFGTVDWLFREYKASEAYIERVSERTRPDYERIMLLVAGQITKRGDRIGDRSIRSITPRAVDKLYARIVEGPRGLRLRQGEKAIVLCRRAWKVVHRLYPELFDRAVPNPWLGATKRRRVMAKKPAATRELVYAFAWGASMQAAPKLQRPRSYASSGFSGRRTCSPATFAGRTIVGVTPRMLSGWCTTRPAKWSGHPLEDHARWSGPLLS